MASVQPTYATFVIDDGDPIMGPALATGLSTTLNAVLNQGDLAGYEFVSAMSYTVQKPIGNATCARLVVIMKLVPPPTPPATTPPTTTRA